MDFEKQIGTAESANFAEEKALAKTLVLSLATNHFILPHVRLSVSSAYSVV
jgi:hypothetical protein